MAKSVLSFRSILFPVMTEDYLLIPDFLTVLFAHVARPAGTSSSITAVIPSTSTSIFVYFDFKGSSLWHIYGCPQSLWQVLGLAFWGHIRMVWLSMPY